MNSFQKLPQALQNKKNRWFFLMNLTIAIVILSAAALLKTSSSRYQKASNFDQAYVTVTKTETNPSVLQHGIVHTEAARAQAYRSILSQSNGTFIIGLLVAVAFVANSIFIYRLSHQQPQPVRTPVTV